MATSLCDRAGRDGTQNQGGRRDRVGKLAAIHDSFGLDANGNYQFNGKWISWSHTAAAYSELSMRDLFERD
jgi:hypothetical protein